MTGKAYDGEEPTAELQAMVNADMIRIAGYGSEHPDEYGGQWHNSDGSYGVSFTDHLEAHEGALTSTLGMPGRLRVQQCTHSHSELLAVCQRIRSEDWDMSEVDDEGRVAIQGFGPRERSGVVHVEVRTGRPDVAEGLRAKYGSVVDIEMTDVIALGSTQ
jgi:hypothetical protein